MPDDRTAHSLRRCLWALLLAGVLPLAPTLTCAAPEPAYALASWPEKARGNHRVLVRVTQTADAVWAHVPWRRRDRQPETKDIRVFDAATGKRVTNVVRVNVTREFGDLVFQPATAPGDYEVYYLPYDPPGTGPFGDAGNYFPPQDTADKAWAEKHGLAPEALAAGKWRQLPRAEVVMIQARGEFHRMDPMEVIATEDEIAALLAKHPERAYLLFPEDRKRPIRMFEDLPHLWIERGPSESFSGEARPGEFYPFQIGVFAARHTIHDVRVKFSDLRSGTGKLIPSSAVRCFNLGGIDWLGRPMTKEFPVGKGKVRPLWIGVPVPKDAEGVYRGTIEVKPVGEAPTMVNVELRIGGAALEDHGDGELWRFSRLRWLDSTLGLDDDVLPPFTPVEMRADTARILGREIRFADNGLPAGLHSGREVLADPVQFVLESASGTVRLAPGASKVLKQAPGTVERETTANGDGLSLIVHSKLEFDGCLSYRAKLRASKPLDLKDIRLEVPLRREVAKYMMGMSRRGGYRPNEWRWKWDVEQADNMVWLGDFDAGLQLKLCGPDDVWQLRNQNDAGVPESWSNGGRGGCNITEAGDQVLVRAYTGERRLEAGEEIELRFRFLITPFKPIDPRHWNWRYGDINGEANILHIHHGSSPNPNINYPFLAVDRLRETVRNVKSIRHKETDRGRLTYPATGNLNLDRGALHVWVRVNFDPQAGQPRQARYNQSLFSLDFPNEDQLGFYWNIDDRGMRAYVRKGSPSQNQYPTLFGTHSPEWRKGQRHLLTLSWGDRLAVFVDGKRMGAAPLRQPLSSLFGGALSQPSREHPGVEQLRDVSRRGDAPVLQFRGSGFILDAIKIVDVPFQQGTPVTPTVDDDTLLLDTFASWDGGAKTTLEKIANARSGQVSDRPDTRDRRSRSGQVSDQPDIHDRRSPLRKGDLAVGEAAGQETLRVSEDPRRAMAVRTAGQETLRVSGDPRRAGGAAANGHGTVVGVCESAPGQFGKEILFSSRKVEIPPKGVNLYYTVRELSNHVVEMWALRSLGDEVFRTGGVDIYTDPDAADKPFKGYPWLREHLVTGYVPAWRTKLGEGQLDAAIATQGLSRWHNYYVEGMRWIMENAGVDGLYLDGIGYDREIMKRIAKVMYRTNPNSRINFHSGDGWCPPWDRDRRMSAANTYMEHFPYLSNLWFGELFDYNAAPDFWLVEISGIPFGLTGEMLNYQTGGNPYRGMIYGMTSRQHPSAPAMWRFWDEFGIQEAEMLGYWDPKCPVRTDHEGVLATVYRKRGKSLIALAHWPSQRRQARASTRPLPKAPVVDGKLSPGEWDKAARLTGFTVFDSDELAREQTHVYVTYDAQNLYVAFRCAHSAPKVKADASQRDGMTWEDDALELFFQPDPNADTYYQFVGNSKGVFADNKNMDIKWDGDWTYKASVGKGHWEGELSIPLGTLGITPPTRAAIPHPKSAIQMGFNICRDQQLPRKQLSCWSPVRGSFHDVNGFGRLVLSASAPVTREQDSEKAKTQHVRLRIDWKALGLDPAKTTLFAPPIDHFQTRAQFAPKEEIPVEPGKGWLLVVESAGPSRP